MKSLIIAAVLCLGLTGCPGKITPAQGELIGCDTFARSLAALATLRAEGKLNDATVNLVEKTRDAVNPICLGQAPSIDASVGSIAVDSGSKVLLSIASSFGVTVN